jgi:hypothetical protein
MLLHFKNDIAPLEAAHKFVQPQPLRGSLLGVSFFKCLIEQKNVGE